MAYEPYSSLRYLMGSCTEAPMETIGIACGAQPFKLKTGI